MLRAIRVDGTKLLHGSEVYDLDHLLLVGNPRRNAD